MQHTPHQLDSEGPQQAPDAPHLVQQFLLLPIPTPEYQRWTSPHRHNTLPSDEQDKPSSQDPVQQQHSEARAAGRPARY